MRRFVFRSAPLIVLLSLVSISSIFAASEQVDQFPNHLTSTSTVDEQLRWKDAFNNWAEQNGRMKHVAGETTRGSSVVLAGRTIQLPDDVFVKAYVVNDDGLGQHVETAQHLPFYALQRGHSTIMVAEHTGFVVNLVLDEADDKPFDFLRGDIKGYLEGVMQIAP